MKIKCTQGMSSKSTIKKKKYTEFEISESMLDLIKKSGEKGHIIHYDMFEVQVGYFNDGKLTINYFHSFQQYNQEDSI